MISDKDILIKAFEDYDTTWKIENMKNKKRPIMMIATGIMQQQPALNAFLGRVVEEKFHMKPLAMSVIPCVPLISNKLKYMVHPEVGPTQLTEGVKEGYFHVNLSANQDFTIEPDFFESTFGVNDDLGKFTLNNNFHFSDISNILILEALNDNIPDRDQPTTFPDDQEIEDPPPDEATRTTVNDEMEDDDSSVDEAEDGAAREYFRSNRRFSDSSSDDDFGMEPKKKDAPPLLFDSDGDIIDEEMERMEQYVEQVSNELLEMQKSKASSMQEKGNYKIKPSEK